MDEHDLSSTEGSIILEVGRSQVQHFTSNDRRCRAVQLPDGIMLRYTLSHALYFYLRSGVEDGKIVTRVYASDSPYDRQKASIGKVYTPMFEPMADHNHLEKVRTLLYAWVDFVDEDAPPGEGFKSFELDGQRE